MSVLLIQTKEPPQTISARGDFKKEDDVMGYIRKELDKAKIRSVGIRGRISGNPLIIILDRDVNISYIEEVSDEAWKKIEAQQKAKKEAMMKGQNNSGITKPMFVPPKGFNKR